MYCKLLLIPLIIACVLYVLGLYVGIIYTYFALGTLHGTMWGYLQHRRFLDRLIRKLSQ